MSLILDMPMQADSVAPMGNGNRIVDVSGNNNHGTVNGLDASVYLAGGPTTAQGASPNALDGALIAADGEKITLTNPITLSGDFTISFMAKDPSFSIVSGNDGLDFITIARIGNGSIGFDVFINDGEAEYAGDFGSRSGWNYYTFECASGLLRASINAGAFIDDGEMNATAFHITKVLDLAANGKVLELKIYDTALTQPQILADYQAAVDKIDAENGYIEINSVGNQLLDIEELGIVAPVSIKIRGAAGLGSVGEAPAMAGAGGGGSAYSEGTIDDLSDLTEFELPVGANGSGNSTRINPNGDDGILVSCGLNAADVAPDGGNGGTIENANPSIFTALISYDGGNGAAGSVGSNYSGGGGGGAGSHGVGLDADNSLGGPGDSGQDSSLNGEDGSESDYTAKGGDGGGQARVVLEWEPAIEENVTVGSESFSLGLGIGL